MQAGMDFRKRLKNERESINRDVPRLEHANMLPTYVSKIRPVNFSSIQI